VEGLAQQMRPMRKRLWLVADIILDFLNSIMSEVRQAPIFQIRPELLDRIEPRGHREVPAAPARGGAEGEINLPHGADAVFPGPRSKSGPR